MPPKPSTPSKASTRSATEEIGSRTRVGRDPSLRRSDPIVARLNATVAQNLRRLRIEKGALFADLADAMHVSVGLVKMHEQGTCRLNAGQLKRYADFFGVPLDVFFEPVERKAIINRIDKHVLTEGYIVPIHWWNRIIVHNKRVKGWKMSPSHFQGYHLSDVWLDD